MTLWQLEWQRLLRTRRWVALVGVHLLFGLLGPLTSRYLGELLARAGGELDGATIILPDPTAADAMGQYTANIAQLGTIVVLVVAAGALAFDAVPEMGVFLRTRVRSVAAILRPRLVVTAAAATGSYVLGALAAAYETWVLIGPVAWSDLVAGALLGALYVVFTVAVVAAVAQWARSVLSTVMLALLGLVALPLLSIVEVVGRWSPSALTGALPELVAGGTVGDHLPSAATAVVASVLLVWVAHLGAARREA